jgi:methionyl-tRNA formyltransferase
MTVHPIVVNSYFFHDHDSTPKRAVVFAYHNVGVRCLKVLLAGGVDVALVVTHQDSATENIWFESVQSLCETEGIPFITPDDAKSPELLAQIQAAEAGPDVQLLLPPHAAAGHPRRRPGLQHARLAAAGIPRPRAHQLGGAARRNQTGASLHEMTIKPDAGAIVSQQAVPILPDDTAFEVFGKVTVAAELALYKVLPRCWTAPRRARPTT